MPQGADTPGESQEIRVETLVRVGLEAVADAVAGFTFTDEDVAAATGRVIENLRTKIEADPSQIRKGVVRSHFPDITAQRRLYHTEYRPEGEI
jgi:hypothetical protein